MRYIINLSVLITIFILLSFVSFNNVFGQFTRILSPYVIAQYNPDPAPDPGGPGSGTDATGSESPNADAGDGIDADPGNTATNGGSGIATTAGGNPGDDAGTSRPGAIGPCDASMQQPTLFAKDNTCSSIDPNKPLVHMTWVPNPNSSATYFEIWRSSSSSTNGTGYHTQIYSSDSLDGNNNFTGTTFITRHDKNTGIDYNWGAGGPDPTPGSPIGSNNFGIRFEGYIKAPVNGTYTFYTTADDGTRFYLGDSSSSLKGIIIDKWNNASGTSAPTTLTGGNYYGFELRYHDNSGSASVKLSWTYPGQSTPVAIPASAFYLDNTGRAGEMIANNVTGYSYDETSGTINTSYEYWMTAVGTKGVCNSGPMGIRTDVCPKPTMGTLSDVCSADQAVITAPFTPVAGSISYGVQRNVVNSINHFNPDSWNTLNNGLISYWKGGVTGTATSPGTFIDMLSSNPAEPYGGVTSQPGKSIPGITDPRAATFNGTGAYLRVENNPSINITNNFSISMWIRPDRVTGIQGLFTKFTNATDKQFGLSLDTSKLRFDYGNGVTNNPLLSAAGTISAGASAWQFVVVTIDSARNIKMYLNGNSTPVAQTTAPAITLTNNSPILMGRWNDSTQPNYYQGQLDEISFWGKPLTPTEITDLYNSGSGNTYSVLGTARTIASAYDPNTPPSTPANPLYKDSSVLNNYYYSYRVKANNSIQPGKINSAGGFYGVDNMVAVADSSSLRPASTLTVSAWVKTGNTSQANVGIITKRLSDTADPYNSYSLGVSPANPGDSASKFNFCLTTGGSQTCVNSNVLLDDPTIRNTWTHLVGTYDSSLQNNNMKLYINNDITKGASGSKTGSIGYSGLDLRIGCAMDGAQCYSGYIDDPRVYNRVLTITELTDLYNYDLVTPPQPKTNPLNGIVGYWKMDEASWLGNPGEVIDSSGNNNNGTAKNGAGIAYYSSSYSEWSSPWNHAPSCDFTPPTANFNLPRTCYTSSTWTSANPFQITVSDPTPTSAPASYSPTYTASVTLQLNGTGTYPATRISPPQSPTISYETWEVTIPASALTVGNNTLTVRAIDKNTPTPNDSGYINPHTFSYGASCTDPWIQTTGGDVHTNSKIDTYSGPP